MSKFCNKSCVITPLFVIQNLIILFIDFSDIHPIEHFSLIKKLEKHLYVGGGATFYIGIIIMLNIHMSKLQKHLVSQNRLSYEKAAQWGIIVTFSGK
jgi:hypothetical protein